jgi:HEAT repeat protein
MTGQTHVVLSAEDRQRVDAVERLARKGRDGLAELLPLLDDKSWAVRRAVVAALASMGDDAVGPLCEIVWTKRSHEARLAAAVDALAASSGNVRDAVVDLATRPGAPPAVICDALLVLGRRTHFEALPLVMSFAKHADDNVGVAAIEAMGRIGGKDTVDPLLAALSSRNFFRTFPAIDALGRTGDPRAIAPLSALLADPLYAAEAARALGRTAQEAAIAALGPVLTSRSDALVRTAALALVDLARDRETRLGANLPMAEALRATVPVGMASVRACACVAGASPSEQLALVHVLGWLADDVAIGKLVELVDQEGAIGEAACEALRAIGEEAMPALIEAIRTGDSARRERLLPIVGLSADVVEVVVACLDDPEPTVRALACEALARAANASVVPGLFRLISDPDARVSQAASGAIQALGSVETKRLALAEAKSKDPRTRRAALRIVAYFGYAEGLDILVEAAHDEDPRIREAGISGLPMLEDARARAALIRASGHAHAKTRASAVRALGATVAQPEIVERLRGALADPDPWVRYYACQALGKLRVHDAEDAIVERIKDPAGQVRVAAVDALASLKSPRALEALEKAAEEEDPDIRRAAILGLGAIRNPAALPRLRAAATSPDAATRLVAVSSLAEFDAPEIVPLLAHAATDPSENVRSAAIGFLSTRPGEAPTKALIEHLGNPQVRERVIAALAVAPEGRVETILTRLESADSDLATNLVSALVYMRRLSGFAAVAAALTFENVAARRAAARALASLSTREATDALRRVAAVDPDPEVRRIGLAASNAG